MTLILQLIATAQLFTEPFLFTGGGPANSTMTVLLLIYHYAFQNSLGGDYGMAAALSLMLAAFLAVFTAGYFWLTRSWSRTRDAAGSARRPTTAGRRQADRGIISSRGLAAAAHPLDDDAPPRRDARRSCSSSGSGRSCGWLKSSITPTQDTLREPMALWPNGFDLGAARDGVDADHIDRYLWNTVVIAFGSWAVQIDRRDDGRLRPVGPAAAVQRAPDGAGPRDAVRAADRAARAALPHDRGRADRPLADDRQRTGRSGCRPGRARSTSSW